MAGQQDDVEPLGQVEVLDPRPVGPRGPDGGEHLGGAVDGEHVVPQRHERVGDPPGARAEVQDPSARRQPVHELGLAHRREAEVDLDGAAVVGDRAGHRKAATNRRWAGVSTARRS